MADFLTLRSSGHFWDNTKGIPTLLNDSFTISNAAGTGASTLLSLLQVYLDRNLADRSLFAGLAMAEDPHFEDHLGQYRVFSLDFSGLQCETLEDIVNFLYSKAEEQYCLHVDLFDSPEDTRLGSWYLAIRNRTLDPCSLCRAFRILRAEAVKRGQKVAVLLDSPDFLELAAKKQHRVWCDALPLRDMLKTLFDFPSEKNPGTIVAINESEEQESYFFDHYWVYHIGNHWYNMRSMRGPFPVQCGQQYPIQDAVPAQPIPPAPYNSWNDFASSLSLQLDGIRERRHQEELSAFSRLQNRPRDPIPEDLPPISPNLGQRRFAVPVDTPQYQARNSLLQELFRMHLVHWEDVYKAMQKLDLNHCTDLLPENFSWDTDPLQEQLIRPAREMGWCVFDNHSEYWLQYNFRPSPGERGYGKYIKAYISFASETLCKPFLDLTMHLLKGAKEDFNIKVAQQVRDDQICCWLHPGDLPVLRDFAIQHQEQLIQPLPFVAYWNGIGLNRELISSYNREVAEIIFRYLSNIADIRDVSLLEMVDRLVQDWSCGELRKFDYHKISMDTLLLFLDSMSVILGDLRPEDSVLLLDNDEVWNKLKWRYSWTKGALDF